MGHSWLETTEPAISHVIYAMGQACLHFTHCSQTHTELGNCHVIFTFCAILTSGAKCGNNMANSSSDLVISTQLPY